jgi:hypothetical protein
MNISNNQELNDWLNKKYEQGHDCVALKGAPPANSTYDDGEPITMPVNVAWQDLQTGEIINIQYN